MKLLNTSKDSLYRMTGYNSHMSMECAHLSTLLCNTMDLHIVTSEQFRRVSYYE